MQVEKQHFGVKLLLIISFYLAFWPNYSQLYRAIALFTLLMLLIQSIIKDTYNMRFIIFGTILEIFSSSLLGLFIIQFFTMKIVKLLTSKALNINNIHGHILLITSTTLTGIITEITIKSLYGFTFDYILYAVCSILIVIFCSIDYPSKV